MKQTNAAGEEGDDVDAARKILIPRNKLPKLPENASRRKKLARLLSPQIHRFFALSMTRKQPLSTARCSRTPACKSDCWIRFMQVNSIWKMTFAPPKLVQSCRLQNCAMDLSNVSPTMKTTRQRLLMYHRGRESRSLHT